MHRIIAWLAVEHPAKVTGWAGSGNASWLVGACCRKCHSFRTWRSQAIIGSSVTSVPYAGGVAKRATCRAAGRLAGTRPRRWLWSRMPRVPSGRGPAHSAMSESCHLDVGRPHTGTRESATRPPPAPLPPSPTLTPGWPMNAPPSDEVHGSTPMQVRNHSARLPNRGCHTVQTYVLGRSASIGRCSTCTYSPTSVIPPSPGLLRRR